MRIQKDITKSFSKTTSAIDKVLLMKNAGIENVNDLVRMSGVAISQFIRLGTDCEIKKGQLDEVVGVGLGRDELHFYEIYGNLLSLGLIEKSIIISDVDFAREILKSNNVKAKENKNTFVAKSFQLEVISSGPNISKSIDSVLLVPSVGGTLGKNNQPITRMEDLSIKQLDILFKGIAQRSPQHELLKSIVLTIQEKLK